jgi:hypothetical protein
MSTCCEHGNEPFSSIDDSEFFNQASDSYIPKKGVLYGVGYSYYQVCLHPCHVVCYSVVFRIA